jgi:hypothetical protein
MAKKIEMICDYSFSGSDHHKKECPGCRVTKGKPFWTIYASVENGPVYNCCVNERKLPHCGKCPELMCERFSRFRDPDMSGEQSAAVLLQMEKELRARK